MIGPALFRFYNNLDQATARSSYETALHGELKRLVDLDQAMAYVPNNEHCHWGIWRDYGPPRRRDPGIFRLDDVSALSTVGTGRFRLSGGPWNPIGQENPDFDYSQQDTTRMSCPLASCPLKAD